MQRKSFTPEQIEQMKSNPHTEYVSVSSIRFTPEFKKTFWKDYQGGKTPREIFTRYGYDPAVLGDSRMSNFAHKLVLNHTRDGSDQPSSNEKKLEARIKTLEFQIDALKKILLQVNSGKPGK